MAIPEFDHADGLRWLERDVPGPGAAEGRQGGVGHLRAAESPGAGSGRRCHRDYISAGSEVIETNTFNGNRFLVAKYGLGDKVHEVNYTAARIARDEAGIAVSVAGKLGPSGKMLVMGEVTADELREAFAEQAKALEEGGVDFFHVETMADLGEVRRRRRGRAQRLELPVAVTMSFDTGKPEAGRRTMMGVTPAQLVAKGDELGLLAVGANCGLGLRAIRRCSGGSSTPGRRRRSSRR